MEGGDRNGSNGGSRWNPTKEQIAMLEGFYRQGLRTPTADQIQRITDGLRAYGHIEGKNVFYWFQNHKARQRQKQKQQQEYLNRAIYHHHHSRNVFYYGSNEQQQIAVKRSRIITTQQQQQQQRHGNRKTLDLFPIHPTGILKESSTSRSSDSGGYCGGGEEEAPFCFDFLC